MKIRRMLISPNADLPHVESPDAHLLNADSVNADSPNADSPKTDLHYADSPKTDSHYADSLKAVSPNADSPNINMSNKEQKMTIIRYVLFNNDGTMVFCSYSLLSFLFIISSNRFYSLFVENAE